MKLSNLKIYLFFITLIFSSSMLFSHPQGDDELVSLFIAKKMGNALLNFEIYDFIKVVGQNYHPPGREFLLLPFLTFLELDLISGRFLTITIYCFLIIQLFSLLNLLNPNQHRFNFLSIILISITGLSQIQAMVSIHGFVTLFGIIVIKKIINLDNKFYFSKEIIIILLLSFFAFLFSNTFLLLSIPLYLMILFMMLKNKTPIRKIVYLFFFILFFYFLYYSIFLGYPYYLLYSGQVEEPFGQLYKYYFRADNSYLNLNSFIDNFKVTNFYTFPLIFYLISLIGFFYSALKFKRIFFLLSVYFLVINFIVNIHTGQHYLSFIIWTLPFGLAYISSLNCTTKRFFKIMIFCLLPLQALYTFYFHINSYDEKKYPHNIKHLILGRSIWIHNLKYPLQEIEKDLRNFRKGQILNLAGVQWTIYFDKNNYFKNDKVEPAKKYRCEDLSQLINKKEIDAVLYLERNDLKCIEENKDFNKKVYKNSSFNLVFKN